jgi:hypothetical protein
MKSSTFITLFLVLLCIQLVFLYFLWIQKQPRLPLFVGISCIFGTFSITLTKLLSILIHLTTEKLPKEHLAHMSVQPVLNLTQGHNLLNVTEEFITDSLTELHQLSSLSLSKTIFYFLIGIITCTLCSESFKQQALSLFPVSRFQSLLFACFNATVIWTHVILFREVQGFLSWMWFLFCFSFGLFCVFRGFQRVQKS